MKGTISNFRSARHHQTTNQMVILPEGASKKEDAEKLLGRIVTWKTPSGKEIKGKVTAAHGRNGCVRALFEKGLPGQSIATKVDIN